MKTVGLVGFIFWMCLACHSEDVSKSEEPSALAYLPLATLPEPIASLRPGLPGDLDELIETMEITPSDPERVDHGQALVLEDIRITDPTSLGEGQ